MRDVCWSTRSLVGAPCLGHVVWSQCRLYSMNLPGGLLMTAAHGVSVCLGAVHPGVQHCAAVVVQRVGRALSPDVDV